MFCPNCGEKVDEEIYKVCPKCRTQLKQQNNYTQPQIVVQNQNTNGGRVVVGGHSILLHLFFGGFLLWIPTLIAIFDGKPWHL